MNTVEEASKRRRAAALQRLRLIALLGGLLSLLLAAVPSFATTVRVFAVGNKLEVRYADSYQNFRDKMFALVDAQQPRRGELVQVEVDDVASHIRPRDANAPALALVNFPEDVGLVAALIGSRGAHARRVTVQQGSTAAFGSLGISYARQIQYYSQLYPGLEGVRYLLLAETDTLYRSFYETFRDIALTYGVYLTATANVAPARRIEASADAALVELLRDPDEAATRTYAYLAVAGDVFNTTFIFDPEGNVVLAAPDGTTLRSPADTDGILRGSLNKAYLTEAEQDILPLSFGRIQDLDVVDTPVGRLAAVISKDAWMIDVNDRYDAKGANLILQPEAFSEWAYVASPWQPDGYKAGGFAQVQRNPSFLYNIAPSLTGNLFEVTFDGQSSIVGKRRKNVLPPLDPSTAWIGQNPDSGFIEIGGWILPDPGVADAQLGIASRRTALADSGAHLLPAALPRCQSPTSFGACENGYREALIWADLQLPDDPNNPVAPDTTPPVPTNFGFSIQVNTALAVRHQHARIAAHAGSVYVAWQDNRLGNENIHLSVSHDRGLHFEEQRVSDNPAGSVVELRPALGLSNDGQALFVVWQELCSGRDDACGRIKLARFDGAGHKLGADVRVDQGAETAGKWNPTLTVTQARNPLVAWVDERDHASTGVPLEHIYFARGRNQGSRFAASVRVDSGPPVQAATQLDNKWAPVVAERAGRIYVVWTDFRNYNWDIYLAHSLGGHGFSSNVRVDDFAGLERIHDHPSIALSGRGLVHAVWADRRDTDSDTDIYYARSQDGGRHFAANRQIDSSALDFHIDRDVPSNQWFPSVALYGDQVLAVWQDNRLGNNDIVFTRSRDGGLHFDHDERVDDSGDGPSNQYRPDLCVDSADADGARLYVVWEDDRNGTADIFMAQRALP